MASLDRTLTEHRHRLAVALRQKEETLSPLLDDLAHRYNSSDRHYHNLRHIGAVLNDIDRLGGSRAPALLLAAWYHNAVYDSRAADNEEQSAALLRLALSSLGVSPAVLVEADRLILLTKTHRCTEEDRAACILLDADLAILGADEAGYVDYARAIRQEYAWVAEPEYISGRARVLQSFLGRQRIYRTARLGTAREESARRNLRRELAVLGRGGTL